jgi:integrase
VKQYPPNSTFGTFYVVKELEDNHTFYRIRQQVTLTGGKRRSHRLARETYRHVPNSFEAMTKHCDRLNYGLDLKKQRQLEIETAFIPAALMASFENQLRIDIPNQKDFRYLHSKVLKEYFLNFFIGRLKLPDPKEWIKRQSDWGIALTGKSLNPKHDIFDKKVSAKTIKTTIQVANRFMKFLHLQLPNEYPAMEFSPFSKAAMKTYTASIEAEEVPGKFITDDDWTKINEKLPKSIGCLVRLMYFYGLRRGESLGFDNVSAVRKSHLNISKQLKSFNNKEPVYSILKDKEQRRTPHWFCTAAECYKLVQESTTIKKMHSDSLSLRWDAFAADLGMDYKLHDFRRTFITRALRLYAARDVQMAVGHANLATTTRYAQDDRALDNDEWKPAS